MKNENKGQMSVGVIVSIVAIIIIVGALSLGSGSRNELNTANVLQTEQTLEDTKQDFDDNLPSKIPGLGLSFPSQADGCLTKLYGPYYNQKMISGEINPNDMQNDISECMEGSMETQLRQTSSVFEAVKHFLNR